MRYFMILAVFLAGCSEYEIRYGGYRDKAVKSCAVAHGWKDFAGGQVQPVGDVGLEGNHWKVDINPWFARAFLHTFPEQWEIDMRQVRDGAMVLSAKEYRRGCVVEKGTYRVLEKR